MKEMLLDVIKGVAGLLVVGLVGMGAFAAYQKFSAPAIDTTVAVIAKPSPAVKRVKQVYVPVKKVKVYEPEAKAKLKLPPAVIASADQAVTGSTTVQPSERRQTVTTVLDVKTGEFTEFVKPEPYPWLSFESRGEARIDVGYKMDARTLVPQRVARLSVTHNIVQVKAVHFGVAASIDTSGSTFLGLGLAYRW